MPRTQPVERETSTLVPPYVTIANAADALSVDRKTIRRLIASGELPAVRIGNRTPGTIRDVRPIRIPAHAIAEMLEPVIGGAR